MLSFHSLNLKNGNHLKKLSCIFLILIYFGVHAQQRDTSRKNKPVDTTNAVRAATQNFTNVMGRVTDAVTGLPLQFINISFTGSNYHTTSDQQGKYALSAAGRYSQVSFSQVGYQSVTKTIKPGFDNELSVKLKRGQTQLKEVMITSGKKAKYRNKDNPAVEIIQQIIDHKGQNRMEGSDYLQYNQYERIGMSLFNLSPNFINGKFFSKYKFMLDTTLKVQGRPQTALPVFFSEKIFENFYRKNPEKKIQILIAQKQVNIIKFIDTAGLDIYLNRLYGNNLDIYENNIFIITNQFLSPIADHAPAFYKFFITDTIKTGKEKLIEVSFTPRAKGDLLFEGKLLVTMDGRYAVEACELNVNKQININFMRSLHIRLDFTQQPGGRYYLSKSNVQADFGLLKNKGINIFGDRTVFYTQYKLNAPLPAPFYNGKIDQVLADANKPDTGYWIRHRTDTLSAQQQQVFAHINKLQNMPSFKRTSWIASTLTGGYADAGKLEFGPIGSTYSFNSLEGSRFQLGARTTPKFDKTVLLEGYTAYGTKDKILKYEFNTYFALNKLPYYRFPNNYFEVSYQYDVGLPGQNFTINNGETAIASFRSGKNDFYLYNKIFRVDYIKDYENHFSYDIAFRNWNQQPAGTLLFNYNDANNTPIHNLTTTELDVALRYAPHEQLLQGTQFRVPIFSKYPIFNFQVNHGFAGWLNGSYNYTNIGANIFKRVYLSQLGYADVTLLGSVLYGKVPFPLLNISPANQTIVYTAQAYNQMDYLEFVSDHYVGLNITEAFSGFFLNKIPIIEHLKWREFLSLKILYGGLRNENNPFYSPNLYQFPTAANGANGTYALGNTPYIEAGIGIGNIFKILRIDGIRRFDYLYHPGTSPYGIKISFSPDF